MRRLRDDRGGVIVLRGTSVGQDAKHTPNYATRLTGDDFVRMRDDLGMNAIRLVVFWEALEPRRGLYDRCYLVRVRRQVRELHGLGFHVVIDMHQDLFGAGFGFAGIPAWAAPPAVYSKQPRHRRPWLLTYFEAPIMRAFDAFWSDEGLWDCYARAWGRLVRFLRGEPGVVLYELFNEPFWGTRTPGALERDVLPRFYARVIAAIRSEDARTPVAVASAPYANAGFQTELGAVHDPRLVYAPHVYPLHLDVLGRYDGDAVAIARHVQGNAADAAKRNAALVVTEVGVLAGLPGAAQFMTDAYDAFDAAQASALHWEGSGVSGYGFWDRDRAWTPLAPALARPFPARVAGEPIRWAWDAARGEFTLGWTEGAGIEGETVVAIPALAFPTPPTVELDGEYSFDGSRLRIPQRAEPARGGAPLGRTLRLRR
jgi:endoglycosylceramidase